MEELINREKRLRELLQASACRECWFVDILKHDFRNSVIVKKLLEKSLLALPDRTSSTY